MQHASGKFKEELIQTCKEICAPGKGILAADESTGTIGQRFETRKSSGEGDPMANVMTRPYRNVMRMHLLIFFFAFAHAIELNSFAVYALVYFVYFFPWRELGGRKSDLTGDSSR